MRAQRPRELAGRSDRLPLEVLQLRKGIRPHPRRRALRSLESPRSCPGVTMRRSPVPTLALPLLLVLAFPGAARTETAASDPKAVAIANDVMKSLGGKQRWE